MMKYALALVALTAVTAPAFAAEYYVVRDSSKKCRVVETKPADTTIVVMGNKAFATRDEAEKQVKVLCKD
jgi:hypothetical protein